MRNLIIITVAKTTIKYSIKRTGQTLRPPIASFHERDLSSFIELMKYLVCKGDCSFCNFSSGTLGILRKLLLE